MDSIVALLSTYNGSIFLKEQLDSLDSQVGVEIKILVRDDGSTDGTQELLDSLGTKMHLTWYQGKNIGPAMSFIDLIYNAPNAEYYAFCDQDDVWMPDKLSVAIRKLKEANADFYYSAYTTVDENLNVLKANIQKHHTDSLGESFVNLEVTGCTVVFTRKLLEDLRQYKPSNIMMHDSWVYKVALALGYKVVYDPLAHIFYRQHKNNVIGAKSDFLKKWKDRYNRWFLNVTECRYNEILCLYKGYYRSLPQNSLSIIEPMINYFDKSLIKRIGIALNKVYLTGKVKTDFIFILSIITKRF
ncbi:MAG: glycosyltransferase family 2 protein [Bacteroidota bacterium]|nr:glycosyltransferase family 2 protein [Bacteroidota bacterium]